jgi:molybdenum cofactor guanylyltransferase
MGGGDKSLLDLAGEPMLARIIHTLAPQVDALAINANGDPDRFRRFGLPFLADTVPGLPGPLAGILAGLIWAQDKHARWLVTTAGDTPFLPGDLIARLSGDVDSRTVAVAACEGRTHPVCALWPVSLMNDLDGYLRSGGSRRVVDYIARHSSSAIDFPPQRLPGGNVDPFFNVNTPDDLAEARRLLQNATS